MVGPLVGWSVTLSLFGLLGATYGRVSGLVSFCYNGNFLYYLRAPMGPPWLWAPGKSSGCPTFSPGLIIPVKSGSLVHFLRITQIIKKKFPTWKNLYFPNLSITNSLINLRPLIYVVKTVLISIVVRMNSSHHKKYYNCYFHVYFLKAFYQTFHFLSVILGYFIKSRAFYLSHRFSIVNSAMVQIVKHLCILTYNLLIIIICALA